MPNRYAHVITGLPPDKHFDYAVPADIQRDIAVGSRVKIPFGTTKRIGVVVNLAEKSRVPRLKSIQKLMDKQPSINAAMLEVTRQLSEFYGCSWGEAVDTALPSSLRKGRAIDISAPSAARDRSDTKPGTALIHEKDIDATREEVQRRIDEMLLSGRQVVVLVPEVSWIYPVVSRLTDHFDEPIAILDKKLKVSEELQSWMGVKSGEVRLAVGTRSAVFAPFSNLGLIVMFDEADESYKQEQSPHYDARQVAYFRQKIEGCDVCFVSHCPSAEVWYACEEGQIEKKVCGDDAPCKVQMVDMTNYKLRKGNFIAPPTENQINAALTAGKKVMIFLNRKGEPVRQLEAEIHRRFPKALVCHTDKDNREVPERANMIIATQAVFANLHKIRPDVIVVARLDSELSWNDYRGSHRAFSLLVYLNLFVRDKVIAQSYNLENYAVTAAMKMDFDRFYTEELKQREELQYPPFKHLVTLAIRGKSATTVQKKADALFEELEQIAPKDMEVMEPSESPYPELKERTRLTIMVKTADAPKAVRLIKRAKSAVKMPSSIITTIDVD